MDLVRIIISVLLPPLGVFLQVGFGKHFWLNILTNYPRLHTRHCACSLGNRKVLMLSIKRPAPIFFPIP